MIHHGEIPSVRHQYWLLLIFWTVCSISIPVLGQWRPLPSSATEYAARLAKSLSLKKGDLCVAELISNGSCAKCDLALYSKYKCLSSFGHKTKRIIMVGLVKARPIELKSLRTEYDLFYDIFLIENIGRDLGVPLDTQTVIIDYTGKIVKCVRKSDHIEICRIIQELLIP